MFQKQEVIVRNRFSDDDIQFILLKSIDAILLHPENYTKNQIINELANARDILERYC